jgi:phosphoglycerate dehydrogenase-like enzyme
MPDPKSDPAKPSTGSAPKAPCTLVIDAPLPPTSRQRLLDLSPRVRVLEGPTPANLAQADVLYFSGRPVDPAHAPRLRWAQFTSAGIGSLTGTPLARSGLPVACASGAYSTTVAEMALALLLSLQRRLPRCGELQRARVWRGDMARIVGDSSRGRTVGIVGYGSIGREVARLTQALGMTVLACKRQPQVRAESHFRLEGTGDPEGRIPAAWYGLDRLADMLARCDAVVVTLPGSPLTAKRIGRAELAALPAHAFLINVGRGSVIDEPALLDALRSGRLAGAGLDVFAEEPLPPESPFWTEPGVILTPHIGSDTLSMAELAAEVLIENVRRDLAGEPLLNVVNFDLGY